MIRMKMERALQPELLDSLPAGDPLAVASRKDLRRVNTWMGHGRLLCQAAQRLLAGSASPCRIVEIGAGDGTLMLGVARTLAPKLGPVHLTLVDRVRVVEPATLSAFENLDWKVDVIETDLWAWIDRSDPRPADLTVANLFLHHFDREALTGLMHHLQVRTRAFLACEPRRHQIGLWGARLLAFAGCNRITRHDAVISVRAGFSSQELSRLWPNDPAWVIEESRVGWFTHLFVTRRS